MIELDGTVGGGQYLRSALALSALTGEAFRMEEVRGERDPPGLKPQHLAAVEVMAEITGAEVSDASVGAEEVVFDPGEPCPGAYDVDIGTAGSVTLLFDAVLPLALGVEGRISVTARGGTDVKWSPPMAYYRRVKLPLLRRFGVAAACDLDRTGFYPAGGGEATLHLAPSSPDPIRLTGRGSLRGVRIYSKASANLADAEVAERQARTAAEELADAGFDAMERSRTYAEADSPGSALVLRLDYEGTTIGADALGERGKPAEEVAAEAAEGAIAAHESAAAVDVHMADQLIALLALSGGRASIPEVTDHVEAGLELVEAFSLPVSTEAADPPVLVGSPRD